MLLDVELIKFIRQGDPHAARQIAVMASVAGLATTVLLALVNSATAATASASDAGLHRLLMFALAFAIFYLANRTALVAAADVVEMGLLQLRVRLMEKVRRADLKTIDELNTGELFVTLSERTSQLSELFPALGAAAQQVLLVVFCALYMLYLSPLASGLVILASLALGWLFSRQRVGHRELIRQDAAKQAELLISLDHFVDGFKEVRTHSERSDALQESFQGLAAEAETSVVAIARTWSLALIFTNLYLFTVLAILAFALPALSDAFDPLVIKLTAVTLFAFGPLTTIMTLLPLFEQANAHLEELAVLEARLEAGSEFSRSEGLDLSESQPPEPFRELRCTGLTFSYRDAHGDSTFTSGPWDLTVRPGETLFIVGGNGSGKSTMLKLLTGLYRCDTGTLSVNGKPITAANLGELRERFCCIFADFHLFDRLYGNETVDPHRVRELLLRMELADKVDFLDGRFTTLALSTGQRKRLALVAALLEDREIYVFDEWAADQDSRFREQFYRHIVPELKARGKAVLVVTHDDRYWHTSDRLLKVDHGLPAREIRPAESL